jgi:hypothetical protein
MRACPKIPMVALTLSDKLTVVPAKAGTHASGARSFSSSCKSLRKDPWFSAVGPWAPACAGVTSEGAAGDSFNSCFAGGDDKLGDLGLIFGQILK